MSKSYLHSIAIFIATLMITLPIYAASANAFITNPRAFGTDEINGFFEENDPIQIEITASIAGDPDITRDQVRFALPNLNVQPEDCPKNADGTTTCASTISQNELGANPENVAIPVTLFDNFGNTDDTDSLIITLDNQPPQITAISSTVLSNGNVRFDFTIKDTANANTARCVGFKAIEITGTSTTTKTLSVDACEISTFISILPSTFTTRTSGIAQVTATLIDKFDQRSQPVSVNVDVTPPAPAVIQSVGDGSLTNLQIQGNDQIIGFVRSGEAIGLVVTARIDGDASIIRQQLEIQLPGGNIPFQQDCSQGNGFFQCVHQVSAGNIGNTKVISIPVTLRNDANQLVASETFNGVVDELPPVASNIAVAFTTNRKIRIQFDVTEKANTQTTQCVGLESVSVVGSAGLKTVPLSVNSCTLSTFVLLDALDVISELRGQHTISIQVNDKFGQSSNSISAVLDLGNGIPLGNNVVATLTNVQVHDSNNINGFIADTNPITLEVTARITSPNDDDTILKKQMQLFRNGQFEPFQNCVPTTDGFHDCSTLLSQSNVNGKSFSLSGSLITDIGEIGPSVIFKGVIDEEDPEIIAIESNLTLARDLRFKANIKDFAHQGSSECVGIKEINFTNGNLQEIKQISVDSCDFTQTFTLPGLSIVPIFQGKHTVTAIVKDKFGHTSKPATYDLDFKQGIRISSGIDTELSNAYVRGSRGISRYVGDGETVRLSVIARTVGDLDDRIRPQQIELLLPSTGAIITFTNCLPKANGYFECTNDLPFSDLGGQKNFSLQATLITDIGEIGESLLLTGAVDEQPPQVLELTVSKSKVGNQKINFTFTVVDTADDTGKHCSGLKNVILSHGIFTKNIDIEEVSGSSSLCKFSSFVEVESSAISSAEEGIIEVKARAFDNFEQESAPAFVSFEVDRTEPEFDQNSFHVLDEEGDDIDFISADNQIATIIANFSDKELNIASIRGDFSSFNESNIKRAPNSCAFDGENASCIWTNILITVDTSNQFPISLEADDEFANELRVTFNHGLDVDTDAPELGVITSERVADNSIFFGKENNNLSVNIREEGVGFNKKEVFFDATALGASDSLQADTCVNLGGEFWNCIWNNVPNGCASDCTPEQQKTHDLFIRPESSD
ncbi:MAG: hypothetical protein O2779_03320, partial [Nanoarchaeota archaeon]|nr:hypothetical protein [Nanoarchaeota archaeon]